MRTSKLPRIPHKDSLNLPSQLLHICVFTLLIFAGCQSKSTRTTQTAAPTALLPAPSREAKPNSHPTQLPKTLDKSGLPALVPATVTNNQINAVTTVTPHVATHPPTPTPAPDSSLLPQPIYFLNSGSSHGYRGVWLLNPGESIVSQVTPADLLITSFDIWQDGRMAYGTADGRLYIEIPGQSDEPIYNASLWTDLSFSIISVSWSPDGSRLAYCVHYDDWFTTNNTEAIAQEFAGLWVLDLEDTVRTKLLDHDYPNSDQVGDPNGRIYTNPVWSPDGTAMLLRVGHWEGSDLAWLDPAIASQDNANLHDPPDHFWLLGTWSTDSSSFLASGMAYSDLANLDRVNRVTGEIETLLDSKLKKTYAFGAWELNDDRIIFAASFNNYDDFRLYVGQQTDEGFTYSPAGPNRSLCPRPRLVWDSSHTYAIVNCSGFSVISLDGTIDMSLSSFLEPLPPDRGRLSAFWGPNMEND